MPHARVLLLNGGGGVGRGLCHTGVIPRVSVLTRSLSARGVVFHVKF